MNDELEVAAIELFNLCKDYGTRQAVSSAYTWEELPHHHKHIYRGVAEFVLSNSRMGRGWSAPADVL